MNGAQYILVYKYACYAYFLWYKKAKLLERNKGLRWLDQESALKGDYKCDFSEWPFTVVFLIKIILDEEKYIFMWWISTWPWAKQLLLTFSNFFYKRLKGGLPFQRRIIEWPAQR